MSIEDLKERLTARDLAVCHEAVLRISQLEQQLAEAGKGPRMFPMQNPPIPIPWSAAEAIYAGYAAMYGRQQSIDRMAERGGFGWGEVAIIYKDPKGRNAIERFIKENQHVK